MSRARGDTEWADGVTFGRGQAAAEIKRLRETAIDVTASLVAAVSLLERGGKKAAPSDMMFEQMLADYRASIERAREALS